MPAKPKKVQDYANDIELFRSNLTNQQWVSDTVLHWCRSVAVSDPIEPEIWDTALQVLAMSKAEQANCVILNNTIVLTNTNRETWNYCQDRGWVLMEGRFKAAGKRNKTLK